MVVLIFGDLANLTVDRQIKVFRWMQRQCCNSQAWDAKLKSANYVQMAHSPMKYNTRPIFPLIWYSKHCAWLTRIDVGPHRRGFSHTWDWVCIGRIGWSSRIATFWHWRIYYALFGSCSYNKQQALWCKANSNSACGQMILYTRFWRDNNKSLHCESK